MGKTRQKKPSKRSIKASQGKSDARSLSASINGTQTPSDTYSISLSHLGRLSIREAASKARVLQPADSTLIEVRQTVGKGIGVFAVRKIPAGTLVVAEAPLVRLTKAQEHDPDGDDERLKESSIKEQYIALPTALRRSYDKLFDTEKPQFSRHKSIFYSNCYNLDQHSERGGACIGLLASRLNHTCGGHNVQFSFADDASLVGQVDEDITDGSESATSARNSIDFQPKAGLILMHAIKDIPKGKELLSSYLSPYMVSQARQNELQMYYKFTCDCNACTQRGFWADSDERRIQMRRLKASVERCEKTWKSSQRGRDMSQARESSKPDLVTLLEAASAIEALTKMASLLVKEGFHGFDLVSVYHDLGKWSLRNGDHASAGRWLAKERELSIICFGIGSKQVVQMDQSRDDLRTQ